MDAALLKGDVIKNGSEKIELSRMTPRLLTRGLREMVIYGFESFKQFNDSLIT